MRILYLVIDMQTHLYVLTEAFKQLKINYDIMQEYICLESAQTSQIFESFDFNELLLRIQNFYSAIQVDEKRIILTHELSDRTSVIEVLKREILIDDADGNMLLPLLKRIYRNTILIDE